MAPRESDGPAEVRTREQRGRTMDGESTVYHHRCEVCREKITSRYCETWEEWMEAIDRFDREHEAQHGDASLAVRVVLRQGGQ